MDIVKQQAVSERYGLMTANLNMLQFACSLPVCVCVCVCNFGKDVLKYVCSLDGHICLAFHRLLPLLHFLYFVYTSTLGLCTDSRCLQV